MMENTAYADVIRTHQSFITHLHCPIFNRSSVAEEHQGLRYQRSFPHVHIALHQLPRTYLDGAVEVNEGFYATFTSEALFRSLS